MQWYIKTFEALDKKELYGILRLRAAVFVVEQDCPYQDVDNKDFKAVHLFAIDKDAVVAYTRIFYPGDYFQETAIGRVVTDLAYRHTGLGKELMQKSIVYIKNHIRAKTIRISAQLYLKKFYESFGFQQVGDSYLEDGIPHIGMLWRV